MRGRQVFSDSGEVAKEALVGLEEIGAKAVVKAEGVLQTVVGHQERLPLCDLKTRHAGIRERHSTLYLLSICATVLYPSKRYTTLIILSLCSFCSLHICLIIEFALLYLPAASTP